MRAFVHYLREEKGTGAAEFALVLLPFLTLVFGIISLSMLLYANQTLQFAAEKAARYYSVQTANATNTSSTLPTASDVQTYAQNAYAGPNISPSFTASTAACGYQVIGTANFALHAGAVNLTVPLQGKACFP